MCGRVARRIASCACFGINVIYAVRAHGVHWSVRQRMMALQSRTTMRRNCGAWTRRSVCSSVLVHVRLLNASSELPMLTLIACWAA